MAFPASLYTFNTASGTEVLNTLGSGTGLSGLLNNLGTDLIATQTKIGTGAATPTSNTVLVGNGVGTSTWSATLAGLTLTTPTIASFVNAGHTHANAAGGGTLDGTNAITAGTITSPSVAVGFPVQIVSTNFGGATTGTTVIPADNTIPQNTEGDEYMTLAITPKSASNILIIEMVIFGSFSIAASIVAALFQDSVVGAYATTEIYQATATAPVTLPLQFKMTAGTASATTFRIRAGGGAAGTFTFNGSGGGARFSGAVTKSFIKITEYRA